MKIPIYQVDAFTARLFTGNPAAVCPLEAWLPDATMQAIAAENNLSETAFFVPHRRGAHDKNDPAGFKAGSEYDLRWFTPTVEVDLCGHATLASAFVVCRFLELSAREVTFHSRSGPLSVRCDGELYSMRFPRLPGTSCEAPPLLLEGLGRKPLELYRSANFLAVLEDEAAVRGLRPRMEPLARLDQLGVIVTAPGTDADFVSRYFVPGAGVPEDPVTGSTHCTLVPYWSNRLGKTKLRALQVSARGGELLCEDAPDHVMISGRAVLYLEGTISTS